MPGPSGGYVTLRAHIGRAFRSALDVRHKPDVRHLGDSADINDVGRLDVTMDQLVLVEMLQRGGQLDSQIQTFQSRQTPPPFDLLGEASRHIGRRIDVLPALLVVRRLHDVIEVASGIVASHVEQMHHLGMAVPALQGTGHAGAANPPLRTQNPADRRPQGPPRTTAGPATGRHPGGVGGGVPPPHLHHGLVAEPAGLEL